MLKNLLFSSCVVLTASSFSFWKMENLYGDSFEKITQLDSKNLEQINWAEIKNYFSYDKHTANSINLHLDPSVSFGGNSIKTWNTLSDFLKANFKFLTCDFDYKDFWTPENLENLNYAYKVFIPDYTFKAGDDAHNLKDKNDWCSFTYKKQQLDFNPDGTIQKLANTKGSIENLEKDLYMFSFFNQNSNQMEPAQKHPEFRHSHRINFKKSFTSVSGVEIENTESGVILKKDGKNIDLNNVLKNYPIEKADSDLLQNSTILAVWCLVPVEVDAKDENGKDIKKIVESQMIGLAKDKDGKLFHWTTDLGKDISELVLN